jgi:hypothetical protein
VLIKRLYQSLQGWFAVVVVVVVVDEEVEEDWRLLS